MGWEEAFLLFLQNNVRTDFLNPIMQFITFLGDGGWFWILICIILLIYKPTRPVGIVAAVSLLAAAVICNGVIKPLVNRTRPFVAIKELELLTTIPHDSSFPSGHSNASFAVACSITWCLSRKRKWIGAILIVIAAAIAFSRLYLGVHYPTDVIAGVLLGTAAGSLTYFFLRKRVLQRQVKMNDQS